MTDEKFNPSESVIETFRSIYEILHYQNISVEAIQTLARFAFFLSFINTCTLAFIIMRLK